MIDFVVMIIGAVILGISSHIALFTIGCLTISICAGLEMDLSLNLCHLTLLKNLVLQMELFL